MAIRARAFGMEVAAYTRSLTPEKAAGLGVRALDLSGLLSAADVVSLHCPLTAETRHLLGESAFELMKPGALLINTARGPLVDEVALVRALETGKIGGAALDVVEGEPFSPANPLARFDNVVITPHSAWSSWEALEDQESTAARQTLQFLRGEVPDHVVNRAVLKDR